MSVYKVCVRNGDLIMSDHEPHKLNHGDVIISNNDIYRGRLMVVHDPDGECDGCPFRYARDIELCDIGCDLYYDRSRALKLMPVDDVLETL